MSSKLTRKLEGQLKVLNLVLAAIIFPAAVGFLLLGLPVIGNVVVSSFADHIGCSVNASGPPTCHFLGRDVGGMIYGYLVSGIVGGMLNPLLFLSVISNFAPGLIPAWTVTLVLLLAARSGVKRDLAKLANSSSKPTPLRGAA